MNGQNEKSLRELIQATAKDPAAELYSTFAKVLEVDENKRTCKVEPVDGKADIFGVRLQSTTESQKGLFLVPKIGSFVLVSFVSNTVAFVASTEQLDKILIDTDEITFNGGNNGGLLIAPKVNVELNKMKARITALESLVVTFASAQNGVAAGVPLLAPLVPAYSALAAGVPSLPPNGTFGDDLINDKIKH